LHGEIEESGDSLNAAHDQPAVRFVQILVLVRVFVPMVVVRERAERHTL
jgi:hypothetical protein